VLTQIWVTPTQEIVEHAECPLQLCHVKLEAPVLKTIWSSFIGELDKPTNAPPRRDLVVVSIPCIAVGLVGHLERLRTLSRRIENLIYGLEK
jgi:hypothetical protein